MSKTVTPEERYREVARVFLAQRGVTMEGKGFGSESLRIGGKIFALLSSKKEFVVKLPRARVETLTRSGIGHPFDPGKGRVMKEWLALAPNSTQDWTALAREAKTFVASGAK